MTIDGSAAGKDKDSVCFRYNFHKGDSLVYRVISHDSISMPARETILRDRKETIAIICDSISSDGLFYLSQVLLNVEIKESGKDVTEQIRLETPWVGRRIWIAIDSAGVRKSYGAADTVNAANSPGGAFQPYLLFALQETCHERKSSWIVERTTDIPENSIPVPMLKYTSIFRILPDIDTLGAHCTVGQYTLTGQGASHVVMPSGQRTRIKSVIAQFGKFQWSEKMNIPVHFYATMENKFTIYLDDTKDDKITGKHYINTYYTLVTVNSPNGVTWKQTPISGKKQKK